MYVFFVFFCLPWVEGALRVLCKGVKYHRAQIFVPGDFCFIYIYHWW